jgi:glycosyltransferase involved in cell wall biosynthesis
VIAVSEATKKELSLHYKTSGTVNDKVRVIYEGWEHLLPYKTNLQMPANDDSGHFLFYIGSSRKHKNLRRLINAFVIASSQLPMDTKLVISGDKQHLNTADQEIVNKLNKNGDRIVFTGFISDSALAFFFKNADGFIFPSLNEGFGLPVVESFFYNKPLLCSNTSSLPEIAGDAALYFDPESIEDIARTIVFFYQNPATWPLMIKRGQQRLTYFSWVKTTEKTVALYKEILLHTSSTGN